MYDLEDRTAKFGERIVILVKKAQKNTVTLPILDQLVRSGTSLGANYCEANGASSKRDFINKIHICKKETKETQFWLRMLAKACPEVAEENRVLWKEADELGRIFSTIATNSKKEK